MKIQKNDTVQILLGKDRGKIGKILRVWTKEGKVLVEGINIYKRHVKKMGKNEGGIVEISKPIDISNVAMLCAECKKPTRVGLKINGDSKDRVCKKCGGTIKNH